MWVAFYVGVAMLRRRLWLRRRENGGEFFAGWVTEYSLSVDNLFVFILIMARFAVPAEYQQTVCCSASSSRWSSAASSSAWVPR